METALSQIWSNAMEKTTCNFSNNVEEFVVPPDLHSATGRGKNPMTTNRVRLLIAEDTRATRNLLFAALDGRKYSIDFAINGLEAVELFLARHYDMVITDLQMPVLDGLSAARTIRQIEKSEPNRGRTPIIALTAGAAHISRETCLLAGMDAYLSKPIDLPKLSAKIKELTKNDAEHSKRKGVLMHTAMVTLNVDKALERMQGNQQLFKAMAVFFVDDHAGLISELNVAVANDQAPQIAQAAHSLKGLAASIGGELVIKVAGDIEALARTEQLGELASLVPVLEREVAALLEQLKSYVE